MRQILLVLALSAASVRPIGASLYLSPDVPTALGATTYLPSDLVLRNDAGGYSLVLSLPSGTPVDGLYRMSSGDWLLSTESSAVLGGSTYDPRDVIRLNGVGAYSLFLNGAAAGIPAGSNVDAIFLDGGDAGDIIFSFDVPTTIAGVTYGPADLARRSGGSFSFFFDSSATSPPIPASTNVTGAGHRGSRTFLTFDVPTLLGASIYLPGQIVTWDGSGFAFVGDFLGVGGLGYLELPGVYSRPDPTEHLLLPSLAPLDGSFRLDVLEPLEECTYLDELKLTVAEHPVGVVVIPDEMQVNAELRSVIMGSYPAAAADFVHEQVVAALADFTLALEGVGLAAFVERHHHDRRAVASHELGLFEKLRLAFLE